MQETTVVTTGYSASFAEVAEITVPSWQHYAFAQAFEFHLELFEEDSPESSWKKVSLVRRLLDEGADRVLWVDADSMFISHRELPEHCDWFSSQDGNGLCNSHMLVKRTVNVMKLLDTLLFLKDPKEYGIFHTSRKYEQDTLKELMYAYPSVSNMVGFLPADMIQHGGPVSNDTVLAWHLPCISNEERVQFFQNRVVTG